MVFNYYLFVALISFMIFILYSTYENFSFAQPRPMDRYSTVYYGCEQYGSFHCDRLHNKLESYEINSSSSTLYNVTDEPTFVTGKSSMALQMYGNQLKSVTFSNTSTISPKHFTISFWIKATSLPGYPETDEVGYIISRFDEDLTGGWSFKATNTENTSKELVDFSVFNSEGESFSSPGVPISKGNFTHIVGTFDGSFIKVYKDGEFFAQSRFNGTYNSNVQVPLTLGVAAGSPMFYYWTGHMDNLAYYDRVISKSEIQKLSNEVSIDSTSKNLIGKWEFNGNLLDSSGNNRHGVERTLISSMAFAPDGRLFFSEKDTGYIKILETNKVKTKPFAKISDHHSNWEQGLLGLTVDPDFLVNHFIYLFYTTLDNKTGEPFNRIVRFTDTNNQGLNETIILDRLPASNGYHSGGAMSFGPDNKLYITIGDATENIECGNLPNSTGAPCPAQNTSSFLGKVLRINRDGSIPTDNPYPGSPIYNIGHRNMYGLAFDNNGLGLVSENGDSLYDEVNTNEKGANYGSPTFQRSNINPELSSNSTKPLRSYYMAFCLTQMIYYDGNKFPDLDDKFLLGTLSYSHSILALKVNNTNKQLQGEEVIKLNHFPYDEVVTIAQSPKGEIYYGGYAISRLDSVSTLGKSQIMFPIEVSFSSPISKIGDISYSPSGKQLTMAVEVGKHDARTVNANNSKISNAFLKVNIPKSLLDGIYLVNSSIVQENSAGKIESLDFTLQIPPNANNTIIDLNLKKQGQYKLMILGKNSYS